MRAALAQNSLATRLCLKQAGTSAPWREDSSPGQGPDLLLGVHGTPACVPPAPAPARTELDTMPTDLGDCFAKAFSVSSPVRSR